MSAPEALVRQAVESLTPNQYDGYCISCGKRVLAGEGYLVTAVDGSRKPICPLDLMDVAARYGMSVPNEVPSKAGFVVAPYARDEKRAARVPTFRRGAEQAALDIDVTPEVADHHIRIQAANGQVYSGLGPGTYTLTFADGHYRTFRVRVQGTEESFAPGKTILEHLVGPQNTDDYQSFGFIVSTHQGPRLQAWKRFKAGHTDLLADAEYFLAHLDEAEVARTCIRCNALLTVPESIALGIGPTCAKRGW